MSKENVTPGRAAMVGAGFIGQSWGIVFARAGWEARLYDRQADVRAALPKDGPTRLRR